MRHVLCWLALAACETPRKLTRRVALAMDGLALTAMMILMALMALMALMGLPMKATAQPVETRAAAQGAAPAAGRAAEAAGTRRDQGAGAPGVTEDHGARSGLVSLIAKIVNFAILAGTLIYVLRSPLRNYLLDRSTQIRHDLVSAAEMKEAAAAQIEEIDRRMKALPGELEMLRAQGAEETAAEEARILAAAAAERDRLLEQARREIDLQVKVARRELVSHAADLAIGVASERIRNAITDEDQKQLVDRYAQQLRS